MSSRLIVVDEHTTLQECTLEAWADLYPLFQDEAVIRYTNFRRFSDSQTFREFLRKFLVIHAGQPCQYGPYAIVYNLDLAGICGIQQQHLTEGRGELWYLLKKAYWGHGLASRAITSLLNEAQSNPFVKIIEAEAVEKNVASWKILEKAGFIWKETIPGGFKKADLAEPLKRYDYLVHYAVD